MISFFSYLFTHKFSHHISKYKEGIEENVNSSIFFFQDLCQLWTMGWHFILIDDCCTGNPVVCLSTQTKFWYEVCSVWSSPQMYIVQCNLLRSISKQSTPTGIQNDIRHSLIGCLKGEEGGPIQFSFFHKWEVPNCSKLFLWQQYNKFL